MPSNALLYEINTRCWLRRLSDLAGRSISLADVPESELAGWEKFGFTHIWLMGVWATGPRSRAEALKPPGLLRAYHEVLPAWTESDVAGSPYAIADYQVPAACGGEAGLKAFRKRLAGRGIKLLLDFVPNHVGLDHAWTSTQPNLFVQSPAEAPGTFRQDTRSGTRWLAHGKDPYFAPWTDTVQLDYRRASTRNAMTDLLRSVSSRCDGVRCDMAMLLLNDVFAKTWEQFPAAEAAPASEFWATAISAVKQTQPGFFFLAEAYWGLEGRLQALGFDCTYDKALYDQLVARDGAAVQRHLSRLTPEYLAASAHFLENHDEPRIASILSPAEQGPGALTILGLPGVRFLHEGQLSGARLRVLVQLGRSPVESAQPDVEALYQQLLAALPMTAIAKGTGRLLKPKPAWPGNPTAVNFVIVQWENSSPGFDLVVANLAPHRSQCYAPIAIEELARRHWSMKDLLGLEVYQRDGADLRARGLYLDVPPHAAQLFHFEPTA
jgi:hypothetical protein